MKRPSGVAVASIVVLLGLWVPLGLVVANSLNADELLVGWGGFTTKWYGEALGDARVRNSFFTSLEVAAVSTALAVAIALTAAMWARRASRRGRGALDASTYMRIILPETVIAIGLFLLLRRFDVALGLATVVIGHVVFNSAYATIVLQARFATMTPDLEEAAADLGATPWRTFRRVTFPSILPALIVAEPARLHVLAGQRRHVAVPRRHGDRDAPGAAPRQDPDSRHTGGQRDRRPRHAGDDPSPRHRCRHLRAPVGRGIRAEAPVGGAGSSMTDAGPLTPADERQPAVRLIGLERRFGDVAAVDGINLDIADGEFFSLIGPSGCGKTTTLRMISGHEEPTGGQIEVKGQPMRGVPPYRRPVTTVFQNYALFPHLDVFENVAFGLRERRTPGDEVRRRVESMLDLVQLQGRETRPATPALGRPATASGACPLARPRSQGAAARRTARRPRPEAPARAPDVSQAGAARGRRSRSST